MVRVGEQPATLEKVCPVCNRRFFAKQTNRVYCSDACRQYDHRNSVDGQLRKRRRRRGPWALEQTENKSS